MYSSVHVANFPMSLRANQRRLEPGLATQATPKKATTPVPPPDTTTCHSYPQTHCGHSLFAIGISPDGSSVLCPRCVKQMAQARFKAKTDQTAVPLGPRMDDTSVGLSLAQLADRARVPTPPMPRDCPLVRRMTATRGRKEARLTTTLIPPRSTPPLMMNSPLHPNTPPRTPPPYHPPTRKRRWTSPHRSRSPSQPHLNLKPPLTPRKCKSTPTPPNLRALPPRR